MESAGNLLWAVLRIVAIIVLGYFVGRFAVQALVRRNKPHSGQSSHAPALAAASAGHQAEGSKDAKERHFEAGKGIPLVQKLADLAACGVKFAPGTGQDDLLYSEDESVYIADSYLSLLQSLGSQEEREPFRQMSSQVYCFDMECIEDPGSYSTILTAVAAITAGSLRLSEISEDVDHEGDQSASVSFKANDKTYSLNFKQDDDWFEPAVLELLFKALEESGSALQMAVLDLGDQHTLLVCLPPEGIAGLRRLGLNPLAD